MPRQKVEVCVVGALPGGETNVESNSEAVRRQAVLKARLGAVDQEPARLLFALREIKVVRYVSLREDERVTPSDWIWSREGDGLIRLGNKRCF